MIDADEARERGLGVPRAALILAPLYGAGIALVITAHALGWVK